MVNSSGLWFGQLNLVVWQYKPQLLVSKIRVFHFHGGRFGRHVRDVWKETFYIKVQYLEHQKQYALWKKSDMYVSINMKYPQNKQV